MNRDLALIVLRARRRLLVARFDTFDWCGDGPRAAAYASTQRRIAALLIGGRP
jgi:hypothetical protein